VGLLNPGGPVAQFKRNRCSISPVELILAERCTQMRLIQRELIIRHSSIISQNGDNSVARFSVFAHYDRFVAFSTDNP